MAIMEEKGDSVACNKNKLISVLQTLDGFNANLLSNFITSIFDGIFLEVTGISLHLLLTAVLL